MSVLDFPSVNPDVGTSLSLKTNSTTFTSELNNAVQTGKLVGDQWSANMPFTNRSEKEGRRIKAFLARLGGMTGRFRMTPPDLNQLGTMSGSGVVDGAGQTGSTLNTTGWDAEQPELFEAGDYIEFNGELKMVTDTVDTAGGEYIEYDGTNAMPSPFDPIGWFGATDPDLAYQSVTEKNPSGESFVGEFEYLGPNFGLVAGSDYIIGATAGDYYSSIICNPLEDTTIGFRVIYWGTSGTLNSVYVNATNGSFSDSQGDSSVLFTPLSNGYNLIQVKTPYDGSQTQYRSQFNFYKVSTSGVSGGFPDIGDKIKCQAAFFGLSGKFQGSVSYPAGNVMPNPFDPSGWSGANDPDGMLTNVITQNPSGQSFSGLAEKVSSGRFAMNTSATLPVVIGDKAYISIMCKSTGPNITGILFRFLDSTGLLADTVLNTDTGDQSGGGILNKSATDLGNGFLLLEVEYEVTTNNSSLFGSVELWTSDNTGSAAIGSQAYVQAIYFGLNTGFPALVDPSDPDQWPANYLAKASIPIAPPIRKVTNDLDAIETQTPQAIFMLADDNQAAWDIQANYIHGASINCIEDVT